MIIVDTNILTEPLKPKPDQAVSDWLDNQAPDSLFLTATVVSEALFGIERLPDGKRKTAFRQGFEILLTTYFANAVLPFNENAARCFAQIVAYAARNGKAIHVSDGQIAAVALERGFAVATRDVTPFEAAGCRVIRP